MWVADRFLLFMFVIAANGYSENSIFAHMFPWWVHMSLYVILCGLISYAIIRMMSNDYDT